jgi:hypothetical protein
MVGIVLVGTAHTFAQGIVGMCLSGGGTAIGELTALVGTLLFIYFEFMD